jgi:hypothetical protein
MADVALPPTAAWQHRGARTGFEVVFLHADEARLRCVGQSTAVQDGIAWAVGYELDVDRAGATRRARVVARTAQGQGEVVVEGDGQGAWRVDGAPRPELDGCLDVDLEASVFTNALPLARLGLQEGEEAQAPAAYVRAADLAVTRLEQRYHRLEDHGGYGRYDYAAPAFGFTAQLVYDASGLVREYPGLAVRAG